jgi:hypothetical protein
MRNEERAACELLKRVLGATFTAWDDGTKHRQVDGLFVLADANEGARDAALEVTTLGESVALQSESVAAAGAWHVDGAKWAWHISHGHSLRMNELEEHLADLVLTCEALGVTSPDEARLGSAAFDWYEDADVRMHGFPESNRPGAMDVVPKGFGGAVAEHLDTLPDWLRDECFPTPLIAGKLAKLADTGRPEQHLFIRVHQTGMPFSLFDPLGRRDIVPTAPLDAPAGLTGLWLVPRWGSGTLLRWDARLGWLRQPLDD